MYLYMAILTKKGKTKDAHENTLCYNIMRDALVKCENMID